MSSLPFGFGTPATGRVFTTNATKGGSATTKQEKSFVDWLIGKITKEDQFYETDPILQGGDTKSTRGTKSGGTTSGTKSGGTTSGKKGTVSMTSKKNNGNGGGGGLGGLFAKKQ